MPKILHAADFHLDSPSGALPPDKAAQRRGELLECVSRIVTLANEQGVSLILLSGDLFDGENVVFDTVRKTAQALSRARARVFISPGNHDFYSGRSPYAAVSWPENVHIFKTPLITGVSLPELDCTVFGAGFDAAEQPASLLAGFSAGDAPGVRLMALHADVNAVAARYNPVSEQDIALSGLDYLALGHTHTFSGIRRAKDTFYAYPGCPEGRGFDETGEKGVIIGEVERGDSRLAFYPVCLRRYDILDIPVGDEKDALSRALAALPPDSRENICRLVFTGETGPDGLDIPAITAALSDRFFHLYAADHTHVRRDVWSLAGEDSLRGLFLKDMQEKLSGCTSDEQRRAYELAVRFGLAALENRSTPELEGWQ